MDLNQAVAVAQKWVSDLEAAKGLLEAAEAVQAALTNLTQMKEEYARVLSELGPLRADLNALRAEVRAEEKKLLEMRMTYQDKENATRTDYENVRAGLEAQYDALVVKARQSFAERQKSHEDALQRLQDEISVAQGTLDRILGEIAALKAKLGA